MPVTTTAASGGGTSSGSSSSGASSMASPSPVAAAAAEEEEAATRSSRPRFKFLFWQKDDRSRSRKSVDDGEVTLRRSPPANVGDSKKSGKKRRPSSMSFTDQFFLRRSSKTSTANSCSTCLRNRKKKCSCPNKGRDTGDSQAAVLGRFEDEDDLYSEVDKANKAVAEAEDFEDAGVCLASVSSSSPASSQKAEDVRRPLRPASFPASPPLSTSTKVEDDLRDPLTPKLEGSLLNGGVPKCAGPASTCSSSMSLLPRPDETCPNCGSLYDRGPKRKLIDSECGHGKCFECMFKSTGGCIICLGDTNAAASAVGAGRIFASVHGRVRAPAARTRHGVALKTSSAFSRESGFQSGAASVCSGPDAFPPSSAGSVAGYNPSEADLDDVDEVGSVVSQGSVISLMSCQSAQSSSGFGYVPENTLRRNDYKRHSMSSLRKFQNGGGLAGQRNSASRRSAIIPRYNPRMSAIEEYSPHVESGEWPLKPLFFEVPNASSQKRRRAFIGRKWLFREILEHLSSPLPTSGGIVIHGGSATGKTAVVLNLVQASCFGQRGASMSSTMDVLAREVIGYHFCQMDNEETCGIPQFVHSLAAQMSQSPMLSSYRKLIANDGRLQTLLSLPSCLADPSKSLVEGVLEPLAALKSQGRISRSTQRCLILVDALCEAEAHRTDNGDTLASFLAAHLPKFPKFIRLICTVRSNLLEVIRPFPFHRLSLDNSNVDERLYKDIHDYLCTRVRDSEAIQRNIVPQTTAKSSSSHHLDSEAPPQASMLGYVTEASNGCFLYAEKVMDLFQTGRLQAKKPSSFSFVPVSLSEIYLLEFNLMFPTTESFSKVKDILAACLASLNPLTRREIFDCVNGLRGGNLTGWEDFCQRMDGISWVVPVRGNETVMFSHSTLRDWLLGRRTCESNKFVVDPRDGHAAISIDLSRRQAPLGPEKTLRLGHHLLKANMFRRGHNGPDGLSVKDLQASWISVASESPSQALACPANLYSPNIKVSRLLLISGASPDTVLDPGTKETLVSRFSALGNIEMVNLLTEFGADANAPNSQGMTPMMAAAARGNPMVVQQLVHGGAAVNVTDSQGSTALVYAVRGGHLTLVNLLLSFPWPDSGCSLSDTAQESLVTAARSGSLLVMETLLNKKVADADRPCVLTGETALCVAAASGNAKACEFLVRHGADVGRPNRKSATPLSLAVAEGHYSVVEMLLNARPLLVEGSCDQMGRSALCIASSEGQVGVMELLISKKANLEWRNESGGDGITPLGWAILGGKVAAVDLLLKSGASLDARDKAQRTAFHQAALIGNVSTLDVLLIHGSSAAEGSPGLAARIEATDKDGIRPIDRAIGHGHEAFVARLLKKGAKLGPTTWTLVKGKPKIALVLLNKLLEDGNTLFRGGKMDDAAYRYEYALKRLPRLDSDDDTDSSDVFTQLRSHLLLNLSRTRRRQKRFQEAVEAATQVLSFRPGSYEALWARGKAKRETGHLQEALEDLREAIQASPQNLELHRFTISVKEELEQLQLSSDQQQKLKAADSISEISCLV